MKEKTILKKISHVLTQGKIPNVKIPPVESLRVTLLRDKLYGIGIPMIKLHIISQGLPRLILLRVGLSKV